MTKTSIAALAAVLALGGCSVTIPSDPDGTLDRVTGGTLRVGVSPNPPWTDFPNGSDQDPTGTEVELVEKFAHSIDADIEWTPGGEEALVSQLEHDGLDLLIGGLTAKSPWSSKVALTYRYTVVTGPQGEEELHVMATPSGENAFLVELERFLLEQELPS